MKSANGKHIGRAGAWKYAAICLAAAMAFPASVRAADPLPLPAPELSEKQTFLLAQAPPVLLPPHDDTQSPGDSEEPTAPDSAPADDSESDNQKSTTGYVFAGDFARQLRKIDPDAKVEWNGHSLRIEASDQKFSLFPTGNEIVVNGNVEKTASPLRIRNGEIYIPQAAITRIGLELEKKTPPTPTPTSTPFPTPTPEPSSTGGILPDITETPGTTEKKKPETPSHTPRATETPSDEHRATPFPKATPTPTPKPTPPPTPRPTPKKTPRPRRTPRPIGTNTHRNEAGTAGDEPFQQALHEAATLSSYKLPSFSTSQLEAMAADTHVKRVAILADDADLSRISLHGNQPSRICLEVAERLKSELEKRHIDVTMVRSSDTHVPLGRKLETIENSKAQLLLVISIGSNSDFADMGGYRILYMNSSVDYNARHASALDASEKISPPLVYQPFEKNSKVLASALKNSLSRLLDRDPVGMNPGPLYLARRAPMAAATVIIGYLSNPADAARLADTTRQDSLATALADGIANYAALLAQGQGGPASGGAK